MPEIIPLLDELAKADRSSDEASEIIIAAILSRLNSNGSAQMSAETARQALEVRFSFQMVAFLHEIARKNQAGQLTDAQQEELFGLARIGTMLDLIHVKARAALSKHG